MESSPTRNTSSIYILLIIAVLTGWAWFVRFIQDDAFISFRYAYNLCHGHGLVFNIGEHVEGYTNFLWTLIIAGGIKTGIDPVPLSQGIGLLLYPVSLFMVYRIGMHLFHSSKIALGGLLLTASNFTFASYATGGLETHMQAFFFLLVFLLHIQICNTGSNRLRAVLSVALALAFLVRMDSAIIIAPIMLLNVFHIWKSAPPLKQRVNEILITCLPAALIAGAWLTWKFSYYGSILPNTFLAKNPGLTALIPGLYYIVLFFLSYGLFLLIIPAGILLKNRQKPPKETLLPLAICILWMLYIVKVGGGFMEFRFFVPIFPFIALISSWLLNQTIKRPRTLVGWLILFTAISLFHSTRRRLYGVETIRGLQNHVIEEKWGTAGQALGRQLKNEEVWIATTAAGAIPYYSKLPTVDILGLNDKWIAKNGISTQDPKRKWLGAKPGHQKKATLEYLVDRNVNLLIGHPLIMKKTSDTTTLSIHDFARGTYLTLNPVTFPDTARLISIPVDEESMLIAVYLIPHPAIENLVNNNDWKLIN